MDDATKRSVINRLGALEFANVELSAQNAKLQRLVLQQAERIKQLEPSAPAANGHDANPYAEQPAAAH